VGELPNKRFFRCSEAARELGVNVQTVRKWARHELIGHVHYPGRLMIRREEIIRVMTHGLGPRP
jgi:predicted site-specific integrase-resolvase